ncbi:BN159_2729 family protein [Streptomyces bauhiniae]|uniref:BN159_2729 family protein n=1 Tax=Streptomyces bauhiniae TaxID=2340725 RepID=UPI003329BDD6
MTNPGLISAVEADLTERLTAVARAFVADLDTSRSLVEDGGADVLQKMRERQEAGGALQAAVDTITNVSGVPVDVAHRVAAELVNRGILREDSVPARCEEPRPQPVPALSPALRGAVVVPLPRGVAPAAPPTVAMHRVEGMEPTVRPDAVKESPVDETELKAAASAAAVTVAAELQLRHEGRLEVSAIVADGERVTVVIRAFSLEDWEYWLTAIQASINVPTRTVGNAQTAGGCIEGVDVHLVAHDVPHLLKRQFDSAGDPVYMWGRIYDLTRGQVDATGRTWLYLGHREASGMPLLVLRGSDRPAHSLGAIVMANGPLTPAPAVSAAVAGETGGAR